MNDLLEKAKNSYMKKEILLEILTNMEFEYVELFDIQTITAFEVKTNGEGKEYVQPLGTRIEIR